MEKKNNKCIIPITIYNNVKKLPEKIYLRRLFELFLQLEKTAIDIKMYKDAITFDLEKVIYIVKRNEYITKIIKFNITKEEFDNIRTLYRLNQSFINQFVFDIKKETLSKGLEICSK